MDLFQKKTAPAYQKGFGLFYGLLHAGYLADRRQIMLKAQQMERSQTFSDEKEKHLKLFHENFAPSLLLCSGIIFVSAPGLLVFLTEIIVHNFIFLIF